MQLKIVVHEQEGGYWAEVPALPGCATDGETIEALLANLKEAIEGYLAVSADEIALGEHDRIMELAV